MKQQKNNLKKGKQFHDRAHFGFLFVCLFLFLRWGFMDPRLTINTRYPRTALNF